MTIISEDMLLTTAERICQSRGVRLTPQRETVLRLIAQQHGAISAYDLLDLLREIEPQAKPPTVYRGLEFLMEQGFIHKIESTNSYVVCHHVDNPSHISVMLICDNCGNVTESDCTTIEKAISTLAEENHFHLRHTVVENHGLCQKCVEITSCQDHEHCDHDHQPPSNPKKKP
ncbi:Zinc uptake regulation protein [Providencia alcalifaciens]|uniref:Zinc uptake transcriptional repressor Zur n=2 Tax=Providencia alcalifaciens TaxID=126385 RepID=A0AAW9VAW0_9GAMM|nr:MULTISPECIES: zinc uptake transcriptional repressor Zur [Providencia]EKT62884.1 zinc uptake transcriptional repressor [Providencia alcalifaciens Dmel2]ETT06626.1 zinc uptake regulation protein [Providencia alcalifaciens F90-2004]EUC95470.1 zinc uptake regulation protein [Providencia alcalifaciens PAL-2]EUD04605.1 zinc uptake regulation protein [Providencia alcalifaciens RIMD 1656011]EUD10286.1 zinc uptake regulation protein [Providencia alcalifaciens 205/92]